MITASVVTYHTKAEELNSCLENLNHELIKRVYVVDNSNQKYIEEICQKFAYVEYIASDNIGYGAANNIAIKKAIGKNSKYHLVINSDISFDKEVIDKLYSYMDNNTDVAQAQPKIVYPNGELQYSCRLLPTPLNLIFRRFLPKNLIRKSDNKYLLKECDHTKEMNIPYHQGSFMFFRTECFNKVGMFDERFFMYPEDIDITRRMHKLYRTMYVPFATVVHNHRAESYKSNKMLRIHIVNMIKYFNKWGWLFDKERRVWNKRVLKEYEK